MPVLATYRIDGNDFGILAVAFPGIRVLRGPLLPPFVTERRVIVVSDANPLLAYPEKDVIQITRRAGIQLDSRKGFLYYLGHLGVRATRAQIAELETMDDADFWREAKLATVLKEFPTLPKCTPAASKGATYKLYAALYCDFDLALREYYLLRGRMPAQAVLSSLLTMQLKARQPEIGETAFYRELLRKNAKYETRFKRAYLDLLDRPDREWTDIDALAFIMACTESPSIGH